MKASLYGLLLLLTLASCSKKNNISGTAMSLFINGDSTFTTTNVITQHNNDGNLYISATDGTGKSINLSLYNYHDMHATYYINDFPAKGEPFGSSATYDAGTNIVLAYTGQINITNYTKTLIQGTYSFQNAAQVFSGTFSAPLP